MSRIRLSPKHGVNPTMPICFWCGKERGEIILLGRLPGDKEAPRKACYDYEPCKECKALMEKGVVLIEVTSDTVTELPAISPGHSPTGRWTVITPEGWERITGRTGEKKCLVEIGAYSQIIAPAKEGSAEQ